MSTRRRVMFVALGLCQLLFGAVVVLYFIGGAVKGVEYRSYEAASDSLDLLIDDGAIDLDRDSELYADMVFAMKPPIYDEIVSWWNPLGIVGLLIVCFAVPTLVLAVLPARRPRGAAA